jgi:hypothetical protein
LNVDAVAGDGQYCRVGKLARYESVPIVLRQTSDRPIAARHVDPTYFRNSVLACAGLPDVPVEVTLAVLNSELIARWYRSRFGDANQRSFPQIKIRNLQQLPMFDRAVSVDVAEVIVERVRSIEEAARAGNVSAVDGLRAEVEALVCRLYGVDIE